MRNEAVYEAMKALWNQPTRPEGLIVESDWQCRGAITALLEMGVRIPQELKLVIYRNIGHDYICPWKVPMLVMDVHKIAEKLVHHLLEQKPALEDSDPFVPANSIEFVECSDGVASTP